MLTRGGRACRTGRRGGSTSPGSRVRSARRGRQCGHESAAGTHKGFPQPTAHFAADGTSDNCTEDRSHKGNRDCGGDEPGAPKGTSDRTGGSTSLSGAILRVIKHSLSRVLRLPSRTYVPWAQYTSADGCISAVLRRIYSANTESLEYPCARNPEPGTGCAPCRPGG
jgi:hypothetical protein